MRDFSSSIHQELCEVPWDFSCLFFLLVVQLRMVAQELVHGVSGWSVDIDLCKHRETGSVLLLRKLFNFCVGAWLLLSELIAGESQNLKAFA